MSLHNFHDDLLFSMSQVEFWKRIYKKAFNILLRIEDKSKDMVAQALGIDTVLHLPFGAKLYIDEKLRKQNYGDFLIEYISNDQKNTPGWVEKKLKIDFIAYAITQSKTVYFIPFKELQELWFKNKEKWLEKYKPPKIGRNKGYNTLNLAIPMDELKSLRIIKVTDTEAITTK